MSSSPPNRSVSSSHQVQVVPTCSGDYKEVCVNRKRGIFSKVDLDFPAEKYVYKVNPHGYVEAYKRGETNQYYRLHRIVCGLTREDVDKHVDHIHHDILDNRRSQLEVTDKSNNTRNGKKRTTREGMIGIKQLPSGRYQVRVTDFKRRSIGTFATLKGAQEAHAQAALAIYPHSMVNT